MFVDVNILNGKHVIGINTVIPNELVLLKGIFWDIATNPDNVYRFYKAGGFEVRGADDLILRNMEEDKRIICNQTITWCRDASAWFDAICLVDDLLNSVYLNHYQSGHQYLHTTEDGEVQLRYGDVHPQLTC